VIKIKFISKFQGYYDILLSSLIAAVACVFFFWNPPVLKGLEHLALDWHFALRGETPIQGSPVRLVQVDDASLKAYGRWPWPRERITELSRKLLDDYKVRTLVTDMVFAEPERNPLAEALVWMKSKSVALPNDYEIDVAKAAGDHQLGKLMRAHPQVVQGFFFANEDKRADGYATNEQVLDRLVPCMFSEVRGSSQQHIMQSNAFTINIPELGKPSGGCGFLNFTPDADGSLRFASMMVEYDGFYFPSLALAGLRNWLGMPPLKAQLLDGQANIQLADVTIKASSQGLVWPMFQGPGGTIPTFSVKDVLEGKIAKDMLQDKLVFLGVSAAGVDDVRATPTDPIMAGTEVQAQIASALYSGQLLQRPDTLVVIEFLMIFIIALGYGLSFKKVIEHSNGMLSFAIVGVFVYITHVLFLNGLWMHGVLIISQIVITFFLVFAVHFVTAVRKRLYLRQIFGTYVDSDVVEEAIRDEASVSLGGDEREMSVLFMDIAGFTTFSERLKPQEVVTSINRFFDAATPIVHRFHGCVDRLTGDGLIALFGAPVRDEKHAYHACCAALELEAALKAIESSFAELAGQPLTVRVGVNSGRMVVGNMGASERVQYTFMGDAGNIGARLESLNKQYGTLRMIGEDTYAVVKDDFICRKLDRVVLKGKGNPIDVYEIMAKLEKASELQPMIAAYEDALAFYLQGDFKMAAGKFAQVDADYTDSAAGIMANRCLVLDQSGEPWHGYWIAEGK